MFSTCVNNPALERKAQFKKYDIQWTFNESFFQAQQGKSNSQLSTYSPYSTVTWSQCFNTQNKPHIDTKMQISKFEQNGTNMRTTIYCLQFEDSKNLKKNPCIKHDWCGWFFSVFEIVGFDIFHKGLNFWCFWKQCFWYFSKGYIDWKIENWSINLTQPKPNVFQ